MYTEDRNAYRKMFFDVWQKHLKKLPLETVETQVLEVILMHPEYHRMLDDDKTFMNQEFALEENPFFHMSLHIALREQIRMDRPAGIREIAQALLQKYEDAEHRMTTVLAQIMAEGQRTGKMPEETEYLNKLKIL